MARLAEKPAFDLQAPDASFWVDAENCGNWVVTSSIVRPSEIIHKPQMPYKSICNGAINDIGNIFVNSWMENELFFFYHIEWKTRFFLPDFKKIDHTIYCVHHYLTVWASYPYFERIIWERRRIKISKNMCIMDDPWCRSPRQLDELLQMSRWIPAPMLWQFDCLARTRARNRSQYSYQTFLTNLLHSITVAF